MNSTSVTSVGSHIVDDDLETTSPVIGATSNWWNTMLLSNSQSQSSTSVEGSVPCLEALNWSCSLPAATTMCDMAGQLPNTMSINSTTRADSQQQLGTPENAFTDSTPSASNRSGDVSEDRVWGEQGCCLSCPSGQIMHGSQNSSVEGLQDVPYPRALVLPEELQKKMEEMLVWDLPPGKTFIFQGDGMNTATMEGAAPTLRYPQVVDDRSSSNVSTLPNVERWSAEEERRHCVSHTDPVNALTPCLEMANSVQFDRSRVKQEYGSFTHSGTCASSSNWTPMQDHFESWNSEQEHSHCVSQTDPVNAFTFFSEMPNAGQFDRNRVKHEYGGYGHSSPCTTSSNWTPAQSRYFRADEFNSNPECSQLAIDQSGNQPLLTTLASDSYGVRWPPLRVHQKLPGAILQQRFRPCHSSLPSAQMIAFGNCLPWNLSDITSFTPEAVRHAQGYGVIDRGFSLQSMQQRPFESKPLKGRIDTFQETPSDPKRNAGSMDTCETGSDGYLKRHCVEPTTPSLPLKQVRKEKLGDRITTLQQLVSPFGKTDTASVLFEAIAYIKFLQEQVQALSIPYMKSSCASSNQNEPGGRKSRVGDKSEDTNEFRHDLRSKGLCLVPLSCTIHVANDNGAEYWNPAYGVAFR